MHGLLPLLGLATLGSVLGLVGGVVFLLSEKLKNFLCRYSVPFAAGILLTVALLNVIPEAVERSGELAYVYILVSFLLVFSFEHLFFAVHHHHGEVGDISASSVWLVIVGDTIHNFVDGVAIASAYLVDPTFGAVIAISTFLHEVPHEIGDFGVLFAFGWGKLKVFSVNLFSAFSTFLGVFVVYFVVQLNEAAVGILLAISAGLFLYLGASDFLPSRSEHDPSSIGKVLTVIVAATVMILVSLILPHG